MKGFGLFLENDINDVRAIVNFWAATRANPENDLPFLVLADWLEESDDKVLTVVASRLRLFVQTQPGEMGLDEKNSLMDASNLLRKDIYRAFLPFDSRDNPSIEVHPSGTGVHFLDDDHGWISIYTQFPHVIVNQSGVESNVEGWLKDRPKMRGPISKLILLEILSREQDAYLHHKGGSRTGRKALQELHQRIYLLLGTPVYLAEAREIASMFEAAASHGGVSREGLRGKAQFLQQILEQIGNEIPNATEGQGYRSLMQVALRYTR